MSTSTTTNRPVSNTSSTGVKGGLDVSHKIIADINTEQPKPVQREKGFGTYAVELTQTDFEWYKLAASSWYGGSGKWNENPVERLIDQALKLLIRAYEERESGSHLYLSLRGVVSYEVTDFKPCLTDAENQSVQTTGQVALKTQTGETSAIYRLEIQTGLSTDIERWSQKAQQSPEEFISCSLWFYTTIRETLDDKMLNLSVIDKNSAESIIDLLQPYER